MSISRLMQMGAAGAGGAESSFGFAATDNSAYFSGAFGNGVAQLSDGNHVIVGRVITSTRYGYLIKQAPDGTVLASYRIDGSAKSYEPSSICIDSSDNIYIGGRAVGNGGQNPCIMKLNSDFVIQWIYVYEYSNSDRVANYNNQYTDICTNDTDVFFTAGLDISGSGVRGLYLRALCSTGEQLVGKVTYSGGGVSQDYRGSIAIDSTGSYVCTAGLDINLTDPVFSIWDISTDNLKSGTNSYRLTDAYSLASSSRVGADNAGNFFCTGEHYNGVVRVSVLAKFEASASTPLTATEYGWSPINNSQGWRDVCPVPTNNAAGDILLIGASKISPPATYSVLAFDVISLNSALTGYNWANRYEMYGSYDSGSNSQFSMRVFEGNRGFISSSGNNLIQAYTFTSYAQTSSLTAAHIGVNSLPIDGSGVGAPPGINVISFTPYSYSGNHWVAYSPSVQNKGIATRVDISGSVSLASYSMFNEIAYF